MYHSFDADIAAKYGIVESLFLCNIAFWVKQNTLNKHNYFEGRYWTYNSLSAYAGLFYYVSESTIKRAIKHLKDEGLIYAGNFNNDRFNHTNYYTLTDKGYALIKNPTDRTGQNDLIDTTYSDLPLFNKNTDSTDISISDSTLQIPLISPEEKLKLLFEDFWKLYPKKNKKQNAFREFKKIKDIEALMPIILDDVERKKQSKDWTKDNGQYIPDPERYIKNERWNDVNEVAERQQVVDDVAKANMSKFIRGGIQ